MFQKTKRALKIKHFDKKDMKDRRIKDKSHRMKKNYQQID